MYEINEIHLSETFAIIILLSHGLFRCSFLSPWKLTQTFIFNTLLPMLELLVRVHKVNKSGLIFIRNSGLILINDCQLLS